MVCSSKAGKIRVRDRLFDGLGLCGDETALDLGCGSGLFRVCPGDLSAGADGYRGQALRWPPGRAHTGKPCVKPQVSPLIHVGYQ
jgi:hypothetical protein